MQKEKLTIKSFVFSRMIDKIDKKTK